MAVEQERLPVLREGVLVLAVPDLLVVRSLSETYLPGWVHLYV